MPHFPPLVECALPEEEERNLNLFQNNVVDQAGPA